MLLQYSNKNSSFDAMGTLGLYIVRYRGCYYRFYQLYDSSPADMGAGTANGAFQLK